MAAGYAADRAPRLLALGAARRFVFAAARRPRPARDLH